MKLFSFSVVSAGVRTPAYNRIPLLFPKGQIARNLSPIAIKPAALHTMLSSLLTFNVSAEWNTSFWSRLAISSSLYNDVHKESLLTSYLSEPRDNSVAGSASRRSRMYENNQRPERRSLPSSQRRPKTLPGLTTSEGANALRAG